MNTPAVRDPNERRGQVIQAEVSQPTAIADAKQSAFYKLGEILKQIVTSVPHAYKSEDQMLAVLNDIDAMVKAHVPNSAMNALNDGTRRATIEDVTLRIAPNTSYSIPASTPQIDYMQLARAMVRAQAEMESQRAVSRDDSGDGDDDARPMPTRQDTAPPQTYQGDQTQNYG
jgi:hypothetical protein